MTFPVDRQNERSFEPSWSGEVVVCDIDRTYLFTRFSSLKGLAQIPFEFAVDKRDIEGMVPLLREVRRGPGSRSRSTPLYFISASPAQLRRVIQRKMMLDGLEFDGTIFKDWTGVLASLRLRRFKEQLGFKVTALMLHRQELPPGALEILIGDDLESDALAFSLFADAMAGRLAGDRLAGVLQKNGVAREDALGICALADSLPRIQAVRCGYIRLERHAHAEDLLEFWPHIAVCSGAFQMALGLWQGGSISLDGVARVAQDLCNRGLEQPVLERRIGDAARRCLIDQNHGEQLLRHLADQGMLQTTGALPGPDPIWQTPATRDSADLWTPDRYL